MVQISTELHVLLLSEEAGVANQQRLREAIVRLEEEIRQRYPDDVILGDSEVMPLKHSFADGIYVREIFIPKGMLIVGKIHKHTHPNFLLQGEVIVVTESGGKERLKAPLSLISAAGTKRVVLSLTDTVWVTVHENPENLRDIAQLEERIIAKDYAAYEQFITEKTALV